MSDAWLDGNELAAALQDVFCVEMTAAPVVCAGCGLSGPLAEVRLYTRAPGLVARCRGCDAVLLRLVRSRDRIWLELTGLRSIEVALAETARQT